jgi:hypothetical protein
MKPKRFWRRQVDWFSQQSSRLTQQSQQFSGQCWQTLKSQYARWQFDRRFRRSDLETQIQTPAESNGNCNVPLLTRQHLLYRHRMRNAALLILAVISLTGVLGHRFYNVPKLDIGTVAPETIRAPESAEVEDVQATSAKRQLARSISGSVYVIDATTNQQINLELQRLLNQAQDIRKIAEPFPFIAQTGLSLPTQSYLRQAPESEWRSIQQALNNLPTPRPTDAADAPTPSQARDRQRSQALSELRNFRRTKNAELWNQLLEEIPKARQRYQFAQGALSDRTLVDLHFDKELLNITESDWQQTRRGIQQTIQRMLAQGIFPSLAPNVLQMAVQLQVDGNVPQNAEAFATQIVMAILRPNIVVDPTLTHRKAEQAAQTVQRVTIPIQRGEVIVRAGTQITPAQFAVLDYFQLSRRGINWFGLLGYSTLVSGAVVVYLLIEKRAQPHLHKRDRLLILLLTLTAPLIATFSISFTSLPLIGLLVGCFYGPLRSVTVVVVLAGLISLGIEVSAPLLVSSTLGAVFAGVLSGRMRSREELALLGGGVGFIQGMVYLLATVVTMGSGIAWYTLLGTASLHGLAGFAWCVVALGLSPYLEHLFDLITPIRLVELSNPNRPLLKRLATEAPGTFQHTLFVATLAEAAAQALKCNVELVRAGTLYHDIGKMHDPLGFIENQMSGPNKHDEINDPWQSADIIKKHVTEGLAMARRCRLPRAIQAFIPEHQGTMAIAYFYHQAQERAKQDPTLIVSETDFRYDGPSPQSRETGIVMLADSCEAALRSLKDATPAIALSMVNKVLKARWQDNQLVGSGLKREEMPLIAEIFVQVWQQYNHQRIAYPKAVLSTTKD